MTPDADVRPGCARVGHLDFFPPDDLNGSFYVDPCSELPGGSDLPGAKLTYEVVVYKPAPTKEFIYHGTLPDTKASPLLRGGSTPPHGTEVHAGETIMVHITATEPTDKGPQGGIREIQLLDQDHQVAKAVYQPVACDTSRLTKTLTATYTVPNNPPPVITLTAYALADNVSAPLSASFPTGNTWEGTSTSHLDTSGCTSTVIETIDFVVAGNGAVSGTSHATANIADSCGTYHPFPLGPDTLSGRLQHNAFTFPFLLSMPGYGRPVSIPLVSTKSASAQFTWTPPGGRPATSHVTLTCITC